MGARTGRVAGWVLLHYCAGGEAIWHRSAAYVARARCVAITEHLLWYSLQGRRCVNARLLPLAPRRRLEQQFEHQQREIKGLSSSMGRLRVDLQRVNGLIAQVGARVRGPDTAH